MANQSIDKQILATAGYHSPSHYMDLLTQHISYEQNADSIAEQFIPCSTVRGGPDGNLRLFVIGVIPPATRVSHRPIDRSASIASVAGGFNASEADIPASEQGRAGGGVVDDRVVSAGPTSSTGTPIGEANGPPTTTRYTHEEVAQLLAEAYKKDTGQDPTASELALYVSQCFVETSDNGKSKWPNNNPGYVGHVVVPQGGSPSGAKTWGHSLFYNHTHKGQDHYFWSYNSPQEGARSFLHHVPAQAREAAKNGDVEGYNSALKRARYYEEPEAGYLKALQVHLPRSQQAVSQMGNSTSAPTPPEPIVAPPVISTATWQNTGTSSSAQATQTKDLRSRSGLNVDTTFGQQLQQAQQQYRNALQKAYDDLANTPPLRFLVNPASLSINNEKVVNDGERSRSGPIVEHWGDGQDTLDVSGKVGAFYALDVSGLGFADGGPGLTRNARIVSAAYQNFLSLFSIYKNNAGIFVNDQADVYSPKTNLAVLGSVYIYYDNTMYIGSFDTFSITEDEGTPFTLEYTFTFTVRSTFSVGRTPEPRTYDVNRQDPRTIKI